MCPWDHVPPEVPLLSQASACDHSFELDSGHLAYKSINPIIPELIFSYINIPHKIPE